MGTRFPSSDAQVPILVGVHQLEDALQEERGLLAAEPERRLELPAREKGGTGGARARAGVSMKMRMRDGFSRVRAPRQQDAPQRQEGVVASGLAALEADELAVERLDLVRSDCARGEGGKGCARSEPREFACPSSDLCGQRQADGARDGTHTRCWNTAPRPSPSGRRQRPWCPCCPFRDSEKEKMGGGRTFPPKTQTPFAGIFLWTPPPPRTHLPRGDLAVRVRPVHASGCRAPQSGRFQILNCTFLVWALLALPRLTQLPLPLPLPLPLLQVQSPPHDVRS
jgi:hypothetical protein